MALWIGTTVGAGGRKSLVFQADPPTGGEVLVDLDPRLSDALGELRRQLPQHLHTLHQQICAGDDPADGGLKALDEVLFDLHSVGGNVLGSMLNETNRSRFYEVLALGIGPADKRRFPADITLELEQSDRDLISLPIELLPIMDPTDALPRVNRVRTKDDLTLALLRYPAFAAIVTRKLGLSFDARSRLERLSTGLVPAKIIRNESFYAGATALSEAEWLFKHPSLQAEQLWPDAEIPRNAAVVALSTCLRDPRIDLRDLSVERKFADQIQHFSCHFTQHDNGTETLGLREQSGATEALIISKAALTAELNEVARQKKLPPEIAGPLIFLNACGSGAVDPKGSLSLVEILLKDTPARAIVATETPVDFSLAATFSRLVYENLFDGLPLGLALHRARWALVDDRQLPFGLFYTLYGNAMLTLV